jgi:AAA domain/UvrD-like helicase C-terminal domain/Nuclease-related domain
MAFTIPETLASHDGQVTPGERKVFVALRDHLPEDYLVYYDNPVGGRHPDFTIVGPDLGLVILEVKDWRLNGIVEITADEIRLRHPQGPLALPNPVRQVRDYMLRTVDALKRRPRLRAAERLCCGWGYGVLLPNLTREEIQHPSLFGPSLEEALGPGLVLTGEDLAPGVLQSRLRALIPAFGLARGHLQPEQVDEIRSVLHPEIRIGWGASNDEIVRVMDREQERLARTLGDGHRLLRGVAGSGKTIALVCRARYLRAQHPEWRLLVVCFNRVLADSLRAAIADDRVEVLTFHAWCGRQLSEAGLEAPPPPGRGKQWDDYWVETMPRLLSQAFDTARVVAAQYQAILIDEGQDFADDWYRVLLRALDPDANRLFIAFDSSQNIYRRRISWRSLGIQVVGHTRVLRRNYRNTGPILAAAYPLIRDLDASQADPGELTSELIVPDQALRSGPAPELTCLDSAEAVRRHARDWIAARLARGVAPAEILVLGHSRPGMQKLAAWLCAESIAASFLPDGRADGTVSISTIHSSKGLDAGHVLIVNVHGLDGLGTEEEARRLLYIAMTRARDELCISSARPSRIMDEVARAVQATHTA